MTLYLGANCLTSFTTTEVTTAPIRPQHAISKYQIPVTTAAQKLQLLSKLVMKSGYNEILLKWVVGIKLFKPEAL